MKRVASVSEAPAAPTEIARLLEHVKPNIAIALAASAVAPIFFFFRTVAACETVLREESHSSSVISVVFRSVLRFGSVSVVYFRGGRSL